MKVATLKLHSMFQHQQIQINLSVFIALPGTRKHDVKLLIRHSNAEVSDLESIFSDLSK